MAAPPAVAPRRVACILGLPIDLVDMAEAVRRVREAVRARTPLFLSTPNLNFAITATRDAAFRESLVDSDLCIADGTPLLWVARLLRVPLRERVSGAALLEALRMGPSAEPIRVYFFGGADGVAETAARRLNEARCGLTCVGWESPGMGTAEELSRAESIARIAQSRADFLVVSLGARKGQEWIMRNRARLGVPVISHLGAALNFVAGTVSRAPPWVQRLGLEWLWRIKEEPGLWRRYYGDGTAFLRIMAAHVLPLAWRLRARGGAASQLRVDEDGREILVRISGAGDGLDPEAMGQLLLLQGRARRAGKAFRIDPCDDRLRRHLRLALADSLADAAGADSASGLPARTVR